MAIVTASFDIASFPQSRCLAISVVLAKFQNILFLAKVSTIFFLLREGLARISTCIVWFKNIVNRIFPLLSRDGFPALGIYCIDIINKSSEFKGYRAEPTKVVSKRANKQHQIHWFGSWLLFPPLLLPNHLVT